MPDVVDRRSKLHEADKRRFALGKCEIAAQSAYNIPMTLLGAVRRHPASRLAFEATILVGAYLSYEVVRRFVAPDSPEAFARALGLIRLEQRLGIFFD